MAAMTRLEPGTPCLRTANLMRLTRLAEVLTSRGLAAHLVAPEGRFPRLIVASEAAATAKAAASGGGARPTGQAPPTEAAASTEGAWLTEAARTSGGAEPAEVYAWRCQDRSWWYWWPWAERIGSDTDLEQAAARIERELTRHRAGAAAPRARA